MTEKTETETDKLDMFPLIEPGGANHKLKELRAALQRTVDEIGEAVMASDAEALEANGHSLAKYIGQLRDEKVMWMADRMIFNGAKFEIERLQSVGADQALTIGTLKDENGRLESLFQQTHGVHHSWVAEVEKLRAELADKDEKARQLGEGLAFLHAEKERLERELAQTKRLLEEERAFNAACAGKVST